MHFKRLQKRIAGSSIVGARIYKALNRCNKVVLVLLFVAANLANNLLFLLVATLVFKEQLNGGFKGAYTNQEKFILFVIAAPLLETMVFQYAVIETLRKRRSILFSCLISAVLFSLSHYYNLPYVLYTFIAGLMFACLYTIGSTPLKGFALTATAHAAYNGLLFCILLL